MKVFLSLHAQLGLQHTDNLIVVFHPDDDIKSGLEFLFVRLKFKLSDCLDDGIGVSGIRKFLIGIA